MAKTQYEKKETEKKSYIYSIQESKVNKTYGGRKEKVNIYQVENNTPVYVSSTNWDTRSYKGDDSEVYEELNKKGLVDKKEYEEKNGYYYNQSSKVQIRKV